jgi:Ca2+-binding RTX toxin-like protein
MNATWSATNIGSGSGSYTLSTTGYNSPNAYEAVTASMSSGASYSTNEVTGGTVVGASCATGQPYALAGYTTGTSLAAAKAATPSATVPSFSNITQNEYVIVWNKECLVAPTLLTPPNGTFTTPAGLTGTSWSAVTDPAGGITYVYQSANSSNTNPDGSFVTPAFTSGALSATNIPTPGTPAGNYWWHVQAKDADGNLSPWSSVWTFTVNNAAAPPANACATPTVAPSGYTLKNGGPGNLSFTLTPFTMFVGKAGNYTVTGPGGDYIVCLPNGNGTVNLGSGNDTITTGNGNQNITVGAGNSVITVGNGDSKITAGAGTDTITAGNGNSTIVGGGGASVCHVGKGNSSVTGCTH